MQYGSKLPSNDLDSDPNYSRNAPQEIYDDETSLGLLPYCAVEDCTLSATVSNKIGNGESSRKAIFGFSCLQPPTPEDKELAFVKDTSSKSPKENLMQYSDQCNYQAEPVEIPKEMSNILKLCYDAKLMSMSRTLSRTMLPRPPLQLRK